MYVELELEKMWDDQVVLYVWSTNSLQEGCGKRLQPTNESRERLGQAVLVLLGPSVSPAQ